jgi:hypothetical protein
MTVLRQRQHTITADDRRHAARFAKLNEWRLGGHFSFLSLADGKQHRPRAGDEAPLWRHGDCPFEDVLDHIRWFNRDRKPAAIVTMPYHNEDLAARALAAHYGLEVHMPPLQQGGWLAPGTWCYAFVRPATRVRWLPEQSDRRAFNAERRALRGEQSSKP